jgi:hypothetical protein
MESDLVYMPAQAVDGEEENGNVIPGGWRDDVSHLRRIERGALGNYFNGVPE